MPVFKKYFFSETQLKDVIGIFIFSFLLSELEHKPCDRAVPGPYSSVAGTTLPIVLLTTLATTVAL